MYGSIRLIPYTSGCFPFHVKIQCHLFWASLFITLTLGCGDSKNTTDGGISSDGANVSGTCVPSGPQCNNCVDDDNDGTIDGSDIHCVSSLDDDESSFATGIPGDNTDEKKQDCFFDGNSGAGDDGCDIHVCCLLDGPCPQELSGGYDPNDCEVSADCITNCAPLVETGCDCFGCCTICSQGNCQDIIINPAVSPECDTADIDDASKCFRCNKVAECEVSCDPQSCVLCPGQTVADLPASCNDINVCPGQAATCSTQIQCASGSYCNNGCCQVQID